MKAFKFLYMPLNFKEAFKPRPLDQYGQTLFAVGRRSQGESAGHFILERTVVHRDTEIGSAAGSSPALLPPDPTVLILKWGLGVLLC